MDAPNVKGVIIAAGYGTRFLPVTKTIPKEMLPVLCRPALDYIIEEFLESGIEDILVVTSRRKKVLEDYLDREVELETAFQADGAKAKLRAIRPWNARFYFHRQAEMRGTGHALLQTRAFVGDSPFVVAYPDDLHVGAPPLAQQLIDTYQRTGCTVLAVEESPPHLERYGVVQLEEDGEHVADLVEKPAPGTAPSNLASIGRFLYTPELFEPLQLLWNRHGGGELYHTGALVELARKRRVVVHRMQGRRLDIGAPSGYLEAILSAAADDPELRQVVVDFAAGLDATT